MHIELCLQDFVSKSLAAEASGAIGVIISNNVPGCAIRLGGSAPLTIPTVGITLADGTAIESALPGVNATLTSNPFAAFDQVVSSCYSGWCLAYGTSMASPAAAGVAALIEAGPTMSSADEFSLFSYRHNAAALGCYQSMGFVIHEYPEGAPMADLCYYLTRPV